MLEERRHGRIRLPVRPRKPNRVFTKLHLLLGFPPFCIDKADCKSYHLEGEVNRKGNNLGKVAASTMSFNIGEKIVYPNYGVGTVENISIRAFGRQSEKFYLLRIVANSMTVMVPFSHVDDVGLRKVTMNGQVERVLEFLAHGEVHCCADWKNRFKENAEKMQHGSMLDVAEVLKSLLQVQARKTLSFREKKMLDRARHMLITEMAASQKLDEPGSITLIDGALATCELKLPPAL